MGENPSRFKGDTLPVEQVLWHECIEFCKKMSSMDGKPFRLPSESEWEYACRAGTITPFHFGETISSDQANFDASRVYGDGKPGINRRQTTAVGRFPPNAWGLFDVHGNVWEWCSDWYGIYPTEDSVDYQGPANGTERVIRGGAWNQIPRRCRSAYRGTEDPAENGGRMWASAFVLPLTGIARLNRLASIMPRMTPAYGAIMAGATTLHSLLRPSMLSSAAEGSSRRCSLTSAFAAPSERRVFKVTHSRSCWGRSGIVG